MTEKKLKQMNILNLTKSMIEILDVEDAPKETKRDALNKLFRASIPLIGADGVYNALDLVEEHYGSPEKIRELLPDKQTLNEDGFVIDDDKVAVIDELAFQAYKHMAPIHIESKEHGPITIMTLDVYNAMASIINPKLMVDPKEVVSNITAAPNAEGPEVKQ